MRRAAEDDLRQNESVAATRRVPNSSFKADRAKLRDLVDRVWGRAMEDTSVPSTSLADEIIDQWMAAADSGPAADETAPDDATTLDAAAIGDVLAGMLRSMESESAQFGLKLARQPGFAPALEAARKHQLSHFHLQLVYPQEKVCQALLSSAGIPPKARWLFQHYRFAKAHVQRIIEMREGNLCCADKARTILSAWLRFELSGVPIAFDYTGEHTFHLPSLVLCTHEEIVAFCDGLRQLHAGKPDQYLKALRRLLVTTAAESSGPQSE